MPGTLPSRVERGSEGQTQVLGCCTFSWHEVDGRRLVIVPAESHPECLAELERAARGQGVVLSLVGGERTE